MPEHQGDTRRRPGVGWRLAEGTGAGRARGFMRFWPFWELVTMAVHPSQPIPNAPFGLLEVQFIRFKGKPITLPDGMAIRRGDRLVELHVHNRALPDLATRAGAFQLVRMFEADLGALARWAETPDFPKDARALYTLTVLGRAGPRLGFMVRERGSGLRNRLDGMFMTGLIALYSPEGVDRLRRGTTYGTYPVEIWMSRGELLRRYGGAAQDAPEKSDGA
jgi:hypothetical protein